MKLLYIHIFFWHSICSPLPYHVFPYFLNNIIFRQIYNIHRQSKTQDFTQTSKTQNSQIQLYSTYNSNQITVPSLKKLKKEKHLENSPTGTQVQVGWIALNIHIISSIKGKINKSKLRLIKTMCFINFNFYLFIWELVKRLFFIWSPPDQSVKKRLQKTTTKQKRNKKRTKNKHKITLLKD